MKKNKILILGLMALTIILGIIGTVWLIGNSTGTLETKSPVNVNIEPHKSIMKDANSEGVANNDLLYYVIFFLSLTTLVSVAISFYLYKWRRILLSNKNMVVPEEWAKYLQYLGKNLDEFRKSVGGSLKKVAIEAEKNTTKISNMTDTYMELQSALDEKDKDIKRLKEGYDAEIFRRFISRFVRIERTVDDFILEEGKKESLDQLKRLFVDAFEECGISKYEPAIGEDYRKAIGITDNPKTKSTNNPDEEFLISEILESGYQLNTGIGLKVIIPSKVRIFKLGER